MALTVKEKMAAARARIKDQKSRGGGGNREDFWLTSEKPSQVRLLPDTDPDELFIQECIVWNIPGFKDQVIDPRSCGYDYSPMQELFDDLKSQNDDSNKIIQGVYALKYLVLFSKCTNLCNSVEVYLKNDFPLIIKYEIASLGEIKLCLAPKYQN